MAASTWPAGVTYRGALIGVLVTCCGLSRISNCYYENYDCGVECKIEQDGVYFGYFYLIFSANW